MGRLLFAYGNSRLQVKQNRSDFSWKYEGKYLYQEVEDPNGSRRNGFSISGFIYLTYYRYERLQLKRSGINFAKTDFVLHLALIVRCSGFFIILQSDNNKLYSNSDRNVLVIVLS